MYHIIEKIPSSKDFCNICQLFYKNDVLLHIYLLIYLSYSGCHGRKTHTNIRHIVSKFSASLQHEITSSKLVRSLDDFKISKIKPKDDFNLTNSKFTMVSNESKKETDNQIVLQKKPIQVPAYGIQRSLKSVIVEELKEPMTNQMQKDLIIKNEQNITKEIKQEVKDVTNFRNNTLEGFTDILNTLSDWFLTLAKFSGELGYNSTSPELV